MVDTCGGEFDALSPYYYSTYEQYDEEKQREFDREEGREEGREEERQNTLREKARADEAFRKIAILEKQLAELMK